MNNQRFIYVSYIKTTADELWEALTSPEFIRQYWMDNIVESDWKKGSSVKFMKRDGNLILTGKILASEKPRVLSYTWSFQMDEALRTENPSQVTFLLERFEANPDLMKLTVTHDDFPENSKAFPRISIGWPMVLSSLKTLLETKRAIHFMCG
ncbi:MAG: SRPBCC family protein [Leptospirales bacterium]